jgi:hypothetical protein
VQTGFIWLRIGKETGCSEHSNGVSDSIKYAKFCDWLVNCEIFKNNFASWSKLVGLVGWLVGRSGLHCIGIVCDVIYHV